MIIKVVISEETWARMLTGKRVEGALSYDKWTGVKAFKAYNRKASEPGSDRLVRKLPWGCPAHSPCGFGKDAFGAGRGAQCGVRGAG